ncbi:MAG: hypothetical protein QM528_00030 [Phycisphaerales bacterium]|nr:hypothetical protein [Phycisphaerales bacterium]
MKQRLQKMGTLLNRVELKSSELKKLSGGLKCSSDCVWYGGKSCALGDGGARCCNHDKEYTLWDGQKIYGCDMAANGTDSPGCSYNQTPSAACVYYSTIKNAWVRG